MSLRIGLVGPCAAGKSTLSGRLRALGYEVRHIAQEHSYVPDMWRRLSKPDILVYLDVSYENTLLRRRLSWNRAEYEEQLRRLTHARQHADIYIDTNQMDAEQTYAYLIEQLGRP